ncbi:hypothetical protein LAUMK41_00106 [Mycobacterium attenuatum]|nr:hypothetical protein LAUMK41_00106 [Mycobacterium attenuatum]
MMRIYRRHMTLAAAEIQKIVPIVPAPIENGYYFRL